MRAALRRRGDPPVVLVHLGSPLPGFLDLSVQQAAAVCGRRPLVIGPEQAAAYRGEKLERFRASERLSGLGLGNFWRYACERFFVLEEYMREAGLTRCLHIESDVLLYVAPREYDGWLRERYGEGVAVCPLTAHEDTAAIMYVGSREALARLTDGLLELVALAPKRLLELHGGPMANEMRMLRLLRDGGLAGALPTTIAEGEALGAPCLFDPASYGQWTGGTHTRPGKPYAGDHHAIGRELIAGRYEVLWDAQVRQPLVRASGEPSGKLWRIANLHVHSKLLERWAWA